MRRLNVLGTGLASLLLLTPAIAQTDVESLIQEYDEAQREWMTEYRAASKEERPKLIASRPQSAKWFPKFWTFIETDPKTNAGRAAALWVVRTRAAKGLKLDQVIGVLHEHHVAGEEFESICLALSRVPTEASGKLLRALEKKNPNEGIKAQACYHLAGFHKGRASMARAIEQDENIAKRYVEFYGREVVDVLKNVEPLKEEKEAEKLLVKIGKTPAYADATWARRRIGDMAKRDLYELRHLGIGKVAPEIGGEDIDGNPMKLSDYRGKVVVLDFWGDW